MHINVRNYLGSLAVPEYQIDASATSSPADLFCLLLAIHLAGALIKLPYGPR